MCWSRGSALAVAVVAAVAIATAACVVGRTLPLAALVVLAAAISCAPGVWASLRWAARRSAPGAAAACIAGATAGPTAAVLTWPITHPVLHLDNAHGAPIDVWIDGVRWGSLQPSDDHREPPRIRVPYGRHQLAWSEVGAPVGLHSIEVDVEPGRDHLYAPGAAGCYWVSVTAYGSASTHGRTHGPLPLAQFHAFDHVDVWFDDTPRRVLAPRLARGAVRVAVQRFKACMELAELGCDLPRRHAFVECTREIDGRAGPADCFGEALAHCPAARAWTKSTVVPEVRPDP